MQEILRFTHSIGNDYEIYVQDGIVIITDTEVDYKFNAEEWKKVKEFIDRQLQ